MTVPAVLAKMDVACCLQLVFLLFSMAKVREFEVILIDIMELGFREVLYSGK